MISTHRLELEKNIIGSVLNDDLYGNVAHIVRSKNFNTHSQSGINHQFVWEAIVACFPSTPITAVTVTFEIVKAHPEADFENYKFNLIQYQKCIMTTCSSHIDYYSIVLVEQDIIEKYSVLLLSIKDRLPGHEVVAIGAITEVYNQVQLYEAQIPEHDIFDIIEHSIAYLKMIGFPEDLLLELINFNDSIEVRTSMMKKQYTISLILHNLTGCSTDPLTELAMKEIGELASKFLRNTSTEDLKLIQYLNSQIK